jgi:hypothetical protein
LRPQHLHHPSYTAAKDIGIAVVCPMRLRAADGRQYNAAIVIHANGSLAKAAYTGSEVTQKQFPVFGYPVTSPGETGDSGGETDVVPGMGSSVPTFSTSQASEGLPL